MADVEVVNRDGKWFVVVEGEAEEYGSREAAISEAEDLTDEPVPVIHERSASVAAEIHTKGN